MNEEAGKKAGSNELSLNIFMVIIVALVAIAMRAWYFIDFKNVPFFDFYLPGFDQVHFDKGAIEIAGGNLIGPLHVEKHAVLYKYFLGIIYFIFGRNFSAVWIIQFIIGALTSILVAASAFRVSGKNIIGLIAGVWYALYGPGIFYEAMELRTFLITFLLVLSMYLLIRLKESGRFLIPLAITMSALMQAQPNTIILSAMVFLYLGLTGTVSSRKFAAFAAVFVAFSVPLLVRSIYVHGEFVFYDYSGPFVFLLGNLPDYSGRGWAPSPFYNEYIQSHNIESYGDAINFTFGKIAAHPLAFILMYLRKFYLFFSGHEIPSNLNIYLIREFSTSIRGPWGNFALITGLAAGGAVLSRDLIKSRGALFIILVGYFASVFLFYPAARFRAPLAPVLIILAVTGAYGYIQMYIEKKYSRGLTAGLIIVLVGFILYAPASRFQQIRPLDLKNLGKAFIANEGRRDTFKAEHYLRKAWDAYATSPEPINEARDLLPGLLAINGAEMLNKGELDKAEEKFFLATHLDYSLAGALEGMVKVNTLKGDNKTAALWSIRLANVKRVGISDFPSLNELSDEKEALVMKSIAENPGDLGTRIQLIKLYEKGDRVWLAAAGFQYSQACLNSDNFRVCRKSSDINQQIGKTTIKELLP